jgi:hypothetical protein
MKFTICTVLAILATASAMPVDSAQSMNTNEQSTTLASQPVEAIDDAGFDDAELHEIRKDDELADKFARKMRRLNRIIAWVETLERYQKEPISEEGMHWLRSSHFC